MSLIHTKLYQNERCGRISMGTHIRKLLDYLLTIHGNRSVTVTPIIEESDVYLSVTQAIPCALVLNELVSNAFKHAFKEGQKGRIEISIKGTEDNKVLLRVKDNGIGIPEEIDILKTESMGLKLTRNTVQDRLMGNIRIERNAGTTVIVEFKILEEDIDYAQY